MADKTYTVKTAAGELSLTDADMAVLDRLDRAVNGADIYRRKDRSVQDAGRVGAGIGVTAGLLSSSPHMMSALSSAPSLVAGTIAPQYFDHATVRTKGGDPRPTALARRFARAITLKGGSGADTDYAIEAVRRVLAADPNFRGAGFTDEVLARLGDTREAAKYRASYLAGLAEAAVKPPGKGKPVAAPAISAELAALIRGEGKNPDDAARALLEFANASVRPSSVARSMAGQAGLGRGFLGVTKSLGGAALRGIGSGGFARRVGGLGLLGGALGIGADALRLPDLVASISRGAGSAFGGGGGATSPARESVRIEDIRKALGL